MRPTTAIVAGLLLAVLMGTGCQASRRVTYAVTLKNATNQPITAWITKTGDRDEAWLAPEDLAFEPGTPRLFNGVVIPAGKTGDFGPITGQFGPEDAAILRVYLGALDYDTLLATSHTSPLRSDLALDVGPNTLEARAGAKLELVPVAPGK